MARYVNADALVAQMRKLGMLDCIKDDVSIDSFFGVSFEDIETWIPVSERLPDEDGIYLVTLQFETGRMVTTMHFDTVRNVFGQFPQFYWNAMAWMPLPKPYNPIDFKP